MLLGGGFGGRLGGWRGGLGCRSLGLFVSDVNGGWDGERERVCMAYRCARLGIFCGRLRVEVASLPSGLGRR